MSGDYPRTRRGQIGAEPFGLPSPTMPPEEAGGDARGYTRRTDDKAAMQRSRSRTHAELEADSLPGPDPAKTGLSMRAAMPCQEGNNQFPYGKVDFDETF